MLLKFVKHIKPSARPILSGRTMTLKPVQDQALRAMAQVRGGVIAAGVGHGKTLIAYGAPEVLGIAPNDTLVLLPSSLRETFRTEGALYAREFGTAPELPVLSYEQLSQPDSVQLLNDLAPKLIICDEAHHLINRDSTRTGRFLRYLEAHPEVMLVVMSGTLINKSVLDIEHLAKYALKAHSPFPRDYTLTAALARCVDPPRRPQDVPSGEDFNRVCRWLGITKPARGAKTAVREAMHARLVETPGFIHTVRTSCDASLYVQEFQVPIAPELRAHIENARDFWELPNGLFLFDDLRAGAAVNQLAHGFYYRPVEEAPDEWNLARLDYARELRRYIKYTGRKNGFDSPARVWYGIVEGDVTDTLLVSAWEHWLEIKDDFELDTTTEIVDTGLLRECVAYADKVRNGAGCLMWYTHTGTASILEGLGVRVCWPGDEPVYGDDLLAVSVQSHGTGKQLQAWSTQVVLTPPANGKAWEQLLGRTHRTGQDADEVWCHVLAHTEQARKALRRAIEESRFSDAMQGQEPKLSVATKKLLTEPTEV